MDEQQITSLQSAFEVLQRNTVLLQRTESLSVRSKVRRSTLQQLVNRFYWQIRYGCQNPSCSTPTCLSCRRRVVKAPLRPFTVPSAKALAAFLVEQENPAQALCPHIPAPPDSHGLQSLYEAKSRRVKALPNGKIMNRADGCYLDEHEVKQIQAESEFLDEASLITDVPEARPKKDFKSISQNLFDTSAWWRVQSISYEGSKFVWAGLPGHENDRTKDPFRKASSKGNFEVPESPTVTGPFVDSKVHYVLSHFDPANIQALVKILNSVDPDLAKREDLKRELGTSRSHLNRETLSTEARFWYRYAYQSMMYIFSSVERLLESFYSPIVNKESVRVLDCAEIQDCLRLLRSVEGTPQRIFPSLWIALGKIYASYDDLKATRNYPYEGELPPASSEEFSKGIDDQKAAHIIGIAIAALNASIPVCGVLVQDFMRFRVYSQVRYPISYIKPYHRHTPQMNGVFAQIQDAFDDDQAMDLASRMVRVWMTHRAIEVSQHRAVSFTSALMDKIESASRSRGSLIHPSSWDQYDKIRGCERSLPSLLLIEWLRRVVVHYWDSKAEIDRMSPVAGAIDWLGALSANRAKLQLSATVFEVPLFFKKTDPIETAVAWELSTSDAFHVLSFPFLFGRQEWIFYFRAINHASMRRATEASLAAARCMVNLQTTFRGPDHRLRERMAPTTNTILVLDIRRDNILTDAMNQLWRRDLNELRRPLKVQLGIDEGEQGVDQGGIQQEFFRLAIAEAFDPDYGLFTTDSTSKTSWFQPGSLEPLYKFEMLGLLASLAVYNGLTLPFTFPKIFYKKLLGLPLLDVEECADGWPELMRGLLELYYWKGDDVEEVFMRSFTFEVPVPGGGTLSIDLVKQIKEAEPLAYKQHGALKEAFESTDDSEPPLVTSETRKIFVAAYIQALTEVSIAPQFEAFRKGFFTLISPKALSLFKCDPTVLKTLMEGQPISNATAGELRTFCTYDAGFSAESETVLFFWEVVENEFDTETLGKLLEFVTSSPRVPIQGISRMPFVIQKNGTDETRMPTSSTCFSRLLLPEYKSKDVLREKLRIALENSQGFGIA